MGRPCLTLTLNVIMSMLTPSCSLTSRRPPDGGGGGASPEATPTLKKHHSVRCKQGFCSFAQSSALCTKDKKDRSNMVDPNLGGGRDWTPYPLSHLHHKRVSFHTHLTSPPTSFPPVPSPLVTTPIHLALHLLQHPFHSPKDLTRTHLPPGHWAWRGPACLSHSTAW